MAMACAAIALFALGVVDEQKTEGNIATAMLTPQQDGDFPSIKYYTAMSHMDCEVPQSQKEGESAVYFCAYLRSALVHKIKPAVLHWGQSWPGNRAKIPLMRDALNAVHDDTIVVFTDGSDVLLQDAPSVVADKFKATGKKFIMGTEQYCGGWNCPEERVGEFPAVSENKFPNSGCWLGYARDAKALLTGIIDTYGPQWKTHASNSGEALADIDEAAPQNGSMPVDINPNSDQIWFQYAFLDGLKGSFPMKFDLDYHSDFCTNLQLIDHATDKVEVANVDGHNVLVRKGSGQKPPIVHFNGNSRELLQEYEKKLWYMADDAANIDEENISLGSSEQSFKSLCAGCNSQRFEIFAKLAQDQEKAKGQAKEGATKDSVVGFHTVDYRAVKRPQRQ